MAFDLGIDGDYDNLYRWLDVHGAKDCGDNVAFFEFEYEGGILEQLRAKLAEVVTIRPRDRIYVIYPVEQGYSAGKFINGGRQQPPWTGYAAEQTAEVDAATPPEEDNPN